MNENLKKAIAVLLYQIACSVMMTQHCRGPKCDVKTFSYDREPYTSLMHARRPRSNKMHDDIVMSGNKLKTWSS